MKKVLFIALAMSLLAMPAFATTSWTDGGQAITAGSEDLSTLSNNVNATVVSNDDAFAAATFHQSGSKAYATSSESTKIFSNSATGLPTLSNSDTTDFNTWDAL